MVFAIALLAMVMAMCHLPSSLGATEQCLILREEQVIHKNTSVDLVFHLPEWRQGQQARLSLDVRVHYPYWCANNPAMTMKVNGNSVVGRDLINKPLDYHFGLLVRETQGVRR